MPTLPPILYHATPARHWARIRREGLTALPVYLASERMAWYYASTIAEDDHEPAIVLAIPRDALDPSALEPDHPGIAEPITTVLATSEVAIHAAWAAVAGTWEDSWGLVESVRYRHPIPSAHLRDPVHTVLPPGPTASCRSRRR